MPGARGPKGHSAVTGVTPAAPCGHLQGRGSDQREGADSQAAAGAEGRHERLSAGRSPQTARNLSRGAPLPAATQAP